MARVYEGKLSAKGRRFGIIVSRFNELIGQRLLEGAKDCLQRHGAEEENLEIFWTPGSFEIPPLARKLALSERFDAVIALGAVIRGGTPHFEYIASEVAKGIAHVALETLVPTIFGIITADTLEQALERAGAKSGNKGWEAALSAIEMVDLYAEIQKLEKQKKGVK